MKKILILGANSYIGTSFEAYLQKHYPERYKIDTIDTLDPAWQEVSFSGYDSVFHVAGIAHSDNGKISKEKEALYYAVNTDLAIAAATKAKAEGVLQFIFMSSIIVYGKSAPIGKSKHITKDTPIAPDNCYSDSKAKAEAGILSLTDERFRTVILRPPMIYGKNCKGNYKTLSKLARKLPVFPSVENRRSVLYIENLAEFVRLMIENEECGIFFPQNATYAKTSELVFLIAAAKGKKIRLVKGFCRLLKLLAPLTPLVNKAFGNLSYDMSLSDYREPYQLYSTEESIKESES